MHKEKGKGMFIIQIGTPEQGVKEERVERKEEKGKESRSYTTKEYGGYSPKEMIKKLEDVKESIAEGKTREALMKIDSCIIRLTQRELPDMKEEDAFSTIDYQLDQVLPNQGKSS
tara:strand:+ start:959 stop:1303 length:345 start_codon:yes stop_codon:yes gene_type:complete